MNFILKGFGGGRVFVLANSHLQAVTAYHRAVYGKETHAQCTFSTKQIYQDKERGEVHVIGCLFSDPTYGEERFEYQAFEGSPSDTPFADYR